MTKRLFPLFLVLAGVGLTNSPAQTNGILRELFSNLPGGSIPNLTNAAKFPNAPDDTFLENAFEAPSNFADNYGQRMRALLLPPTTGAYTFYLASDDNSVLYLSRDADPVHKVQIAFESTWTGARQYNHDASQKSAPVNLTNGMRYYIEALQKEGAGGDNLAVTWQTPGGAAPADGAAPIPGANLVPYGLLPPILAVQPTNAAVVEAGNATFAVALAQKLGASYQWYRNGTAIAGATNTACGVGPAALADNGSKFFCAITNWLGVTNSAVATLTVTPDVTPPGLSSVASLSPQVLVVVYTEPVEPASATNPANYTLNNGVVVLAAAFGPDARTVFLSTTAMSPRTYLLTVNNVRDRAATPNLIQPNSQWVFSLLPTPLDISYVRPGPELIGPSSRHGPVVISEIMYHPTNRPDGKDLEYLELYNSNPFFEDISGYQLAGLIHFTFPTNTVLGARAFLVVAAAPADIRATYGVTNVIGPYTNRLSNGSGTLRLCNREGATLFQVSYSGAPPWPAAADGAGHALVLARPSLGERNPAAWAASDLAGGSPGWTESIGANPYRAVLLNEVLAHTDPPDYDFIELFNYGGSSVDLSGCVLTDDPQTNKFVLPTNTVIQAQGFASFDERQLGFRLSAAGETVYLKNPDGTRVLDCLRFGAQQNGVSYGRSPDGAPDFYRLAAKTPGSSNSRPLVSDVVINEIMYDPVSGDDNDQYVELYNRTSVPVDLSRWRLQDAVQYTVPSGTVLGPNSYLVVAKDALRLLSKYSNLTGANTLGDFSGALAHGGERLALAMPDELLTTNSAGHLLTNFIHIVVDEVTYETGGRWGQWAHGGGSSLELLDPRSNHRRAPNWADSDETGKSGWVTVEATGVLDNGNGAADSLQVTMLGPGECLVDNVEVFASGGPNRVRNPTFDSGLEGWVAQGNHEASGWEAAGGYTGTACLHVRATDHGDTGANRIRTALSSPLSPGQTATLRAKVRWLKGHPEILLRLKGNWLEATGNILNASNLGTPGAPNSRAGKNPGPAITSVRTSAVLPSPGQGIAVVARADDPDGLAGLFLKYRVDPSTNFSVVTMANNGAGLFSGQIPGQAASTLVAFHIEAIDNAAPRAVTFFPNDAPARECLVRWGEPSASGGFGTYHVWMTQATLDRWSKREHLSNQPLDCTFVYGNSRAVYNIGGEYSGSPWHAPGYDSPIGNVCDYLLTFSEDDPLLGETEATLQWPGNGGGDNSYQREQTAYWLAEQLGLPYCYRRSVNLFINGTRRAELFEDVQQPNADMDEEYFPNAADGDLHKLQIWYEFDDAAANFTAAGGASFQNVTTTGGLKKLPFYRSTFAKRAVKGSASNFTNLFALVDTANFSGLGQNYRQQLETAVDVDNWLKTYAVEHVVGNNDSFAYGGGQNMYTYKPTGDTWKMLIWDIDFAFAVQPPTSDVFEGIGRSNGIDLGEPAYRRRYWQILQDLANGPLTATRSSPLLDARYNAMVAAGRAVENPSAIKSYISQRRANLLNLLSSNVPARFAITLNSGADFSTSQSYIWLTGTAPIDVRTVTINGVAFPVVWTSLSNWMTKVAFSAATNALNLAGLDAKGNPVAGASAAINVNYTGAVESPQGRVVINEIMYHPAAPNASFIELYNASSASAFDLSGWQLGGADFVFPGGTVMLPRSYLVVAEDRIAFSQAYGRLLAVAGVFNGKLDNAGETLRLIKPAGAPGEEVVVDEVRYDSQPPWPAAANGGGPSLQLIDPAQDNNRVANWAVAPTNGLQWRYVAMSGTASSGTLYIYLQAAGETYLDDLKLVAGTVAENGANLIANGDFESTFPGPWGVSPNLAASGLSTTLKHGGAASLHVVATSPGTTRSSAIYQDLSPAPVLNAPYTLSFWYLENTNGGTLTVRLSGNGIAANANLSPAPMASAATPGAANSVAATLPPLPRLWLNEVLPNNISGLTDRFDHHHPWLELYNSGPTNLDLTGMFLANNYSNLTQWPFPTGTTLGTNRFLLVWLDGHASEASNSELHTSFTIATNAGSVALVSASGSNILDYLNYSLVQPDRSYGAYPDGAPAKRQAFFYPTPGASNNPASPPLNVTVNEWMADNKTTLADPADSAFQDWFELYNFGDTTADLSGYYLGTSLTNKTKFLIPSGYAIPARGYLVVWADSEPSQNSTNRPDLHTNFKLSKNGEGIGLFGADGTVVDFVSFGPQTSDVSEGRFPDGDGTIAVLDHPSPGGPNSLLVPNSPPQVDPIPDHVVFEGELVLLNVAARDVDEPPQHLRYTLDPGAPVGAALNPDSGLFAWRPSPDQAPSTNWITVRVTDDGAPPLGTTATFCVRVALRPQITSALPGPTATVLTFSTLPGRLYRVEYKDWLQEPVWHVLASESVATAETLTLTDSSAAVPQRFYRVVVAN